MEHACVMSRPKLQRTQGARPSGGAQPPGRNSVAEPERFPVALRAYVPAARKTKSSKFARTRDAGPSGWAVIFDTETTTDPAQRLRFGSYQVRIGDALYERGLFYDPEVLRSRERQLFLLYASAHKLTVRTRSEFVEKIFFGIGYDFRANIIGFNLPFDISRLAISYASSRGRLGSRPMTGRFSFKLSETQLRPRVVVKHHSRSLSFIQFAADPTDYIAKSVKKRGEKRIRRGYFLDLRTTARALTRASQPRITYQRT